MRALFFFVAACQPVAAPPAQVVAERVDSCRNDIADCVAACAMRESRRLDFIDYYDRRCAAAVLGKNPDELARRARDPSECHAARTLDMLCSVKDAKETVPTTSRK
ncbi:MAG TPA: hypothetical protein VGH87_24210 [Polyangiaceae bacterium]